MSSKRRTVRGRIVAVAATLSLLTACDVAPPPATDRADSQAGKAPPTALDVGIDEGQYDPPPLYAAITDEEVARVQALLAAGEEVNQHDPVYGTPLVAALQAENAELVDILLRAGASRAGTSAYFLEARELVERVGDAEFRRVADDFAAQQEATLRPADGFPALLLFNLPAGRGEPLVQQHQASLQEQGWFLFRFARDARRRQDIVGLLPTADKYTVIAYLETDGLNYNITTERIIDWLKQVEKKHPFVITEAGLDYVGGTFRNPIGAPRQLAEQMFAFCPDIVDQGIGSIAHLAEELAKPSPALYLWWD